MLLVAGAFLFTASKAAPNDKIEEINRFVEEQRLKGKIPGISLVIVEKGETVYEQGFGYADLKEKKPVTGDTLFELGSTTKAFTGLAIFKLEKEGLLKRTDEITKYLPWLELIYNGQQQRVTIDQLLHHTSGIPSTTITLIPESHKENALEATVKTLIGRPLNRAPGSSFEYATINYDVLGLLIETVTQIPYDIYMKEHLLHPIGMHDSFVGLHQVASDKLAVGYKLGFMREQVYTPPVYRGNIPAGYIVSNAKDIAKWLHIQVGAEVHPLIGKELIEASHLPDLSVAPFDQNTHYAGGWGVLQENNRTYILHSGENPTFSSYMIMNPSEQIGIAVMANMKTSFTTAIGQGVMDLYEGRAANSNHADSFQTLDQIVTFLCILIGCIGAVFVFLTIWLITRLAGKKRKWTRITGIRALVLGVHVLIVGSGVFLVLMAPNLLLGGLPWSFIKVWAPTSLTFFLYSFLGCCLIYLIWGLMLLFTKRMRSRRLEADS
ncbi:serine hydrolase domain-containing protein [Paenibacillus turpanensis]|uniref:serine hydrolase domain-containing protein n=1 Tax=Paenibacillus turpanensis TaxID=2689078 RepID=UPI0014079FAD|nr:serine hydrolase domain-containing protein [Paenibacillus turpanensis]